MTLNSNECELIEIYRKLKPLYKECMMLKALMILNEQKLRDPLEHIKSYNKWSKLNSINNINYFRNKKRKSSLKALRIL